MRIKNDEASRWGVVYVSVTDLNHKKQEPDQDYGRDGKEGIRKLGALTMQHW